MNQAVCVTESEDELFSAIQAILCDKQHDVPHRHGKFTIEEDNFIVDHCMGVEHPCWLSITQEMAKCTGRPKRDTAQVSQRWRRVLQFKNERQQFSAKDDEQLLQLYMQGYKWAEIAKVVGGKTDLQVKYRISVLLKKL